MTQPDLSTMLSNFLSWQPVINRKTPWDDSRSDADAPPMPTEGMEVDRKLLRSALIRQRPNIIASRDAAVIACATDPAAWYAVHQVTLAEYLARLDRVEALCDQAEAELAAEVHG